VTAELAAGTEPLDGPVAWVTPFDTDDEAVALANAVAGPVPAAAYLWTADRQRARRLAAALAPDTVWVNDRNPGDEGGDVSPAFYTRSRTVRTGRL
jgi:acyl-CoA reductase-like NAD-dependent aldehyde dehydrogenase